MSFEGLKHPQLKTIVLTILYFDKAFFLEKYIIYSQEHMQSVWSLTDLKQELSISRNKLIKTLSISSLSINQKETKAVAKIWQLFFS